MLAPTAGRSRQLSLRLDAPATLRRPMALATSPAALCLLAATTILRLIAATDPLPSREAIHTAVANGAAAALSSLRDDGRG